MKRKEFLYWLQGSFEITNIEVFNKKQIKTIKNHLNLANEVEKENDKGDYFIKVEKSIQKLEENDEDSVIILKKRLSDCFLHVIDNSYDGDLEKQQILHDGGSHLLNNNNVVMKC